VKVLVKRYRRLRTGYPAAAEQLVAGYAVAVQVESECSWYTLVQDTLCEGLQKGHPELSLGRGAC
jgi:hypothetical protein